MSLAMAKGDTPTVSLDQLKEELRHLQKDVCTIDGRRVLTFGQVLDFARRRGLPIRFDQAWGTARHVWFHFDKDLEHALLQGLQSHPIDTNLLIENAWLLDAVRACTSDRPTAHIRDLEECLHVFVKENPGFDLVKHIDQVSEAGLPIERSHSSKGDIYVWFYFGPATLRAFESLGGLVDLQYQQRPAKGLFTDRYVPLLRGESKGTTMSTPRAALYVGHLHDVVPDSIAAKSFAQIHLPLTHYDEHVLQNADRLSSIWMQINPGRYLGNETCMKLIMILIRTVAVRQSWLRGQKRLYMDLVVRRINMWAPELIQMGLTNALQTAQKLDTTIQWSPKAKRINVARLLAPILNELRRRCMPYRRNR